MMLDAAAAQLFAHDARQRAALGLGDICDAKLLRMKLVSSSHSTHNGDVQRFRSRNQTEFA